jgi:transposase
MLPKTITCEGIRQAADNATIPSARNWEKALLLAIEGGRSAQQIADESGLSRAWLFARKSLLAGPGGLDKSFQRGFGGGKPPSIDISTLEKMKSRFSSGHTAETIKAWLANEEDTEISLNGVYYYRRKLGFTQSRTVSKAQHKSTARQSREILYCLLDKLTNEKIKFLINYPGFPPRALRVLEVLSWLGERTRFLEELRKKTKSKTVGHAFPARKIVTKLKCRPALLYRVARLYRKANSNWDSFVEMAFAKGPKADIIRHVEEMSNQLRQAKPLVRE